MGYLNPLTFATDYLLINPALSSTNEIGTLLQGGTFNQLSFNIGLESEANLILPGSLPDNHPLSYLDSTMYDLDTEQYLSNRIELETDINQNTLERIISYGSEREIIPIILDIPGGFALPPGFDLDIEIEVNYADWFSSIQSITNDPDNTIIDEIVGGLPISFKLVEISADQP